MSERPSHWATPSAISFLFLGFSIIVGGLAIILGIMEYNHQTAVLNNGYLRLNACIVSVQPERRTPAYVKHCYDVAEHDTGVTLIRYGDGK